MLLCRKLHNIVVSRSLEYIQILRQWWNRWRHHALDSPAIDAYAARRTWRTRGFRYSDKEGLHGFGCPGSPNVRRLGGLAKFPQSIDFGFCVCERPSRLLLLRRFEGQGAD